MNSKGENSDGPMSPAFSRRKLLLSLGSAVCGSSCSPDIKDDEIMTVLGPIPARKLGRTLVHEHVIICHDGPLPDGNEWKLTGSERDQIFSTMKGPLRQIKEASQFHVTGWIDCTPAYMGRDPKLLARLASETGLHIVTNTGLHGGSLQATETTPEKHHAFLPAYAFSDSAEQLAQKWTREFENGIDNSGVRPGFIKIGIHQITEKEELSEINRKLVVAAAITSNKTGLAVTCHTAGSRSKNGRLNDLCAVLVVECFRKIADLSRLIVAHSQECSLATNLWAANDEEGAWIAYDAISDLAQRDSEYVERILEFSGARSDRLLLSQDAGYYWSESRLHRVNYLTADFLPKLKAALDADGKADEVLQKLMIDNPAKVFALRRT